MIQGTTETLIFTIEDDGVVLPDASAVWVTIQQKGTRISKNGNALRIDGKTIEVELTQAESLRLTKGTAEAQANWLVDSYGGKQRIATIPVSFEIEKQLLPKVLT